MSTTSRLLCYWIWAVLVLRSLCAQESHLALAYAGNNLWNPGLQVRWEQSGHGHSFERRGRPFTRQWLHQAQLGAYWDPGSQVGSYLQAGLGYRRIHARGRYVSLSLHPLGVFRSWLPTTYAVGPDGAPSQVRLPGRWYYAPSLQAEWGWPRQEDPGQLFLSAQLSTLLPYNTYVLPLLLFSVGYRFPSLSPDS